MMPVRIISGNSDQASSTAAKSGFNQGSARCACSAGTPNDRPEIVLHLAFFARQPSSPSRMGHGQSETSRTPAQGSRGQRGSPSWIGGLVRQQGAFLAHVSQRRIPHWAHFVGSQCRRDRPHPPQIPNGLRSFSSHLSMSSIYQSLSGRDGKSDVTSHSIPSRIFLAGFST